MPHYVERFVVPVPMERAHGRAQTPSSEMQGVAVTD